MSLENSNWFKIIVFSITILLAYAVIPPSKSQQGKYSTTDQVEQAVQPIEKELLAHQTNQLVAVSPNEKDYVQEIKVEELPIYHLFESKAPGEFQSQIKKLNEPEQPAIEAVKHTGTAPVSTTVVIPIQTNKEAKPITATTTATTTLTTPTSTPTATTIIIREVPITPSKHSTPSVSPSHQQVQPVILTPAQPSNLSPQQSHAAKMVSMMKLQDQMKDRGQSILQKSSKTLQLLRQTQREAIKAADNVKPETVVDVHHNLFTLSMEFALFQVQLKKMDELFRPVVAGYIMQEKDVKQSRKIKQEQQGKQIIINVWEKVQGEIMMTTLGSRIPIKPLEIQFEQLKEAIEYCKSLKDVNNKGVLAARKDCFDKLQQLLQLKITRIRNVKTRLVDMVARSEAAKRKVDKKRQDLINAHEDLLSGAQEKEKNLYQNKHA